ncbi:MAG TPA: fused MFS/spermidine synthase [Bryobacteraceae bacterium]|nr:fused MFS/spermidine synthase [Bryobacteraceae bacterium]
MTAATPISASIKKPGAGVLLLYGSTIFLSAFLLFAVQPMFAKLILPWFGGTAGVWTTCLMFFEVALLGGYAYSYLIGERLSPRAQFLLHAALLIAALFSLPILPGARWQPHDAAHPEPRILALLAVVLGLPYFLLSTTGPLLQSWIARTWPGSQPYRLFALSNAGALTALIAYPSLIEPAIATRAQVLIWSAAFAVFAILCVASGWISRGSAASDRRSPTSAIPAETKVLWVALSAAGSMLLLATTNQITENIAAVPFLWIIPLAIYLITFILCFESTRWYRRGIFLRLLAMGLGAVAYSIYDIQFSDAVIVAVPVFSFGLFAGCMFCHGELSRRKPPREQLTVFYLMIALGGALGAVFVGLIAPAIFSGIYELPIALFFVAALALALNWDQGWAVRLLWTVASVAMAFTVAAQVRAYHQDVVRVVRNFYGALRVMDTATVRTLYHGTVKHGSQFLSAERRDWPTTYYGPSSGAGLALRWCCDGAKNVGAVGLGAGTVSTYGRRGDRFRFYEINPAVLDVATSQFSFLRDTAARVEVALGDARLTMEREAPQNFDVLLLDAFSGDAIPVHLLTEEAFAVYRRHLKPDGILAVHVSNQYLDLAPVVARLAKLLGEQAIVIHSQKSAARELSESVWVLVTRNRDFLGRAEVAAAAVPVASPMRRAWTDDYNNLLQVIRWAPLK